MFVNRLIEMWSAYKSMWEEKTLLSMINTIIYKSAERSEKIFPKWYKKRWSEGQPYSEIIEEMKAAFLRQMDFVDNYIMNLKGDN